MFLLLILFFSLAKCDIPNIVIYSERVIDSPDLIDFNTVSFRPTKRIVASSSSDNDPDANSDANSETVNTTWPLIAISPSDEFLRQRPIILARVQGSNITNSSVVMSDKSSYPSAFFCERVKYFKEVLPKRTLLTVNPIIQLGKVCVYNADCTECSIGYSQVCLANRCQCIARRRQYLNQSPTQLFPYKNTFECATHLQYNARLIYYDRGLEKCVLEKAKNTTKDTCHNHDVIKSLADGKRYCLKAIDAFDMICYENKMCQDAFNTEEIFGFCQDGICHGQSVKNFQLALKNAFSCDPREKSYCKEFNYVYHPISHLRNAKCVEYCKHVYNTTGVAATYAKTCLCFQKTSIPATEVDDYWHT